MYLSRLRLNFSSAAARRDLAEPYELHRTLARVYAPDDATPPPRFLWRLEADRRTNAAPTLLVQAETPGRWQILEALDGYAHAIDADKPVDLKQLVQAERRYRFRLLANATVTRGGKRLGLRTDEALQAWIARQGTQHGFELQSLDCRAQPRMRVARRRGAQAVVIDPALFEGVLEAADPDALRTAVRAGLGHGKAFGLGLLSLARLR